MDTINMIINILGFIAGLAAAVLALVFGIMNETIGLIAAGVWGLISVPLAWFSGAKASPTGNPFKKSIGAKFKEVPDTVWYIIAGLLVVVVIIAVVEGVVA